MPLGSISKFLSLAVVTVAIVTALTVYLGPPPQYPGSPQVVRDPYSTIMEPTDRLVFIAWLLIAVVGLVWFTRMVSRPRTSSDSRASSGRDAAVGALSVATAVFAMFWLYLPSTATPFALAVACGAGLTALSLWIMTGESRLKVTVARTLGVGAISVFLVAWLQTPQTIRDQFHFPFSVEEIAAPVVGRVPLSDFFPQYSNILGWPLVPVQRLTGLDVSQLSLAWLLALQMVTVAAALVFLQSQGDWNLLVFRLLVLLAPLVAWNSSWASSMSYFAVMPLRTVLPLVVLALLTSLFWKLSPLWFTLVAGAGAGVSALNNPDFSVGVVVAAIFAVFLRFRGETRRLAMVLFPLALVAPIVIYDLVSRMSGRTINWSEFLLSQLLFARDGYMAEIMRPFGLHVLMAAVFIACAVVGIVVCHRSSTHVTTFLPIALAGIWGIFCMPYFVNRSLPGTLLLGLAIPFSVAIASLLPVLKAGWLRLADSASPTDSPVSWATALLLVLVSGTMSLWALAPNPSARIGLVSDARWSQSETITASREALTQIRAELLDVYGADVDMAHVVKFSGLSTVGGSRSASVVSDPHNFSISGHFVRQQCREFSNLAPDAIVIERDTLMWLELEETCNDVSSSYQVRETGARSDWIVLVRNELEGSSA